MYRPNVSPSDTPGSCARVTRLVRPSRSAGRTTRPNTKSRSKPGHAGLRIEQPRQPVLQPVHGLDHVERIEERAESEDDDQGSQIAALREAADPRAPRVGPQLLAGHSCEDADIVARARMDAVEAERTVHVAHLALLEKRKLAAPCPALAAPRSASSRFRPGARTKRERLAVAGVEGDGWQGSEAWPRRDTVFGPAAFADGLVADLDLHGREQRPEEVELAERADVLAESSALKERVDDRSAVAK